MNPIKPKALQRGDTISVVAPAGPVDRERIDRAFDRVRGLGFRLKTYGDIYRRTGYLAGDDQTRADELMAAFADPGTSAVWCARGGYGVMRILDHVDFAAIGRHPKVFVGFSDITILHLALQQYAGFITFHGPNLQDGFGKPEEMPQANAGALWRALSGSGVKATVAGLCEAGISREPAGVTDPSYRVGISGSKTIEQPPSKDGGYSFDLANVKPLELRTIRPGRARGRLTGGNLAVIAGLMGTPYEIETAGRILFLEDVSERAYRIDRYLAQLTLAGKLQSAAAVILGTFSYDEGDAADSAEAVNAVLKSYFARLDVPVLAGFPTGHAQYNLTLPIGALAELDSDKHTLKLLENPVATQPLPSS